MKFVDNYKPVERQKGNGRKPIINTNRTQKKVKEIFNHKTGKSQTAVVRKFVCSHRTIGRILNEREKPILLRKRMKRPGHTSK
jgi:hypothetical protein